MKKQNGHKKRHAYHPGKRKQIDPNKVHDRIIAERRSVTRIINQTERKIPVTIHYGIYADNARTGFKHNGVWKYW